jgi:hypothetical protein
MTITHNLEDTKAALEAAIRRRIAIEAEEQVAAEALRVAEQEAEQQKAKIEAAKAAIAHKASERQRAEREQRLAEAQIRPEPVTKTVAREAATELLGVIDWYTCPESAKENETQAIEFVWRSLDKATSRLMTDEVDEDAIEVVLAIEGYASACERWALHKGGRMAPASHQDREGLGVCPVGNRRVDVIEAELRAVLAGEKPKVIKESIGQLIGQGLDLDQICRVFGFVFPNGAAARDHLGAFIESGEFSHPCYEFIRWMGAGTIASAWAQRLSDLPGRIDRNIQKHAQLASSSGMPERSSGFEAAIQRREAKRREEAAGQVWRARVQEQMGALPQDEPEELVTYELDDERPMFV